MKWLDKINSALDYIEDNLDGVIELEVVAKKACTSTYNFQRMFSYIADVTLAEYIRRRRLSLAGIALTKSDKTVLEIANQYGYDSQVSFARAFYNLHGITPKEAKKEGAVLKNYPRISFQITIKGVEEMEYRIETTAAIHLVGVSRTFTTKNEQNFKGIPKFWMEVKENGVFDKMMKQENPNNQDVYGVCYQAKNDVFDYMIAVSEGETLPEGCERFEIPACTWAKFDCYGPMPDAMQAVWKRIYSEWFPTSGYEHSGGAELEVYPMEQEEGKPYHTEIWIPVKKA